MKKIYIIIPVLIVLLLLANIYYYLAIYNKQLSLQKNILLKQTQVSSSEIERMGYLFESDLNYIIFSENFIDFFSDPAAQRTIITKLEIFYSKYENLVSNIVYFDRNNNVYNLFRDRKNKYISDSYVAHKQKEISHIDKINLQNGEYLFYLPVFRDNQIEGNLVVTLDYLGAISSVFNKSHMEGIQWQWLIDTEGNILYNNYEDLEEFIVPAVMDIANEVAEEMADAIQHRLILNGEEKDIISAFYSIRFLRHDFGIVFSMQSDLLLRSIISNSIAIAFISTLLILLIILFYYFHLRENNRQLKIVRSAEENYLKLINNIPMGIIMYDEEKIVKLVNNKARTLFEGVYDIVEGKKLGDRYVDSFKKKNGRNIKSQNLDEVILYKKKNEEYWLLINELVMMKGKEKFTLDVIGDVTVFEKARKQKAIAVKTKSDFLANMSHEIRTPLNGIIGLTESLDLGNLKVKQKDFVLSIKKSAELLLSIVDDILTYSKIEAGKMIIDEIPFKLREEMDHAVKLLTPRAQEKNLTINLRIDDNIPDNIIGDPFKIRQIINHLGDNAIKFTERGLINLRIEQLENISGKLRLQFVVEDTGIGIQKEDIDSIFSSFNQLNGTAARKFEGSGLGTTLSKQMVELLRGEIRVESPSGLSEDPSCPGTRFIYNIELFADERRKKEISVDKITSYSHINVLVIKDNDNYGQKIMEMLKNFGLSARLNFYQEKTINLIESNLESGKERYHILILRDSVSFDAFKLAEALNERGLVDKYLIIMASSNDKKGNYVRSRKLGIDYYLIEPCNGSEFFNIFQENFPNIKMTTKNTEQLTRLRKDIEILVAEDNLINQKVNKTFFKNLGYEIDIAENGKIAVEMTEKKDYDIVFMDIMMPEMDGWEATGLMRDKGKDFPIVAITADIGNEARDRAKEEGMNDFIPKPVRIEEIKRVLLRWFSEQAEGE